VYGAMYGACMVLARCYGACMGACTVLAQCMYVKYAHRYQYYEFKKSKFNFLN